MRTPVWLVGLRRRPAVPLLLMLLAAAAVLASVTGPLLVRAVQQSSLQSAVEAAGPAGTEITVSGRLSPEDTSDTLEALTADVATPFTPTADGPDRTLWRPVAVDVATTADLGWRLGAGPGHQSRVVGVTAGGCAPFRLVTGRCPIAGSEALVSTLDAGSGPSSGATGTSLHYSAAPGRAGTLRVVGVYDPERSEPWRLIRPGTVEGRLAAIDADPVVIPLDRLAGLGLGAQADARLALAAGLRSQDEAAARRALGSVQAGVPRVADRQLGVDSGLLTLLDRVDTQTRSATVIMLVVVVQAELVSLFALVVVLQRLGRLRAPEWAIGRLRGLPVARWLGSVLAEPGLAILLGVLVGFAAGVGLAQAVVGVTLRAGTPVEWTRTPVLVAAAATAVAALLGLVATSAQVLTRPLVEVIQQAAEPRRLSRFAAVVQAAVVLAAGAAGYQLLAGGTIDTTGSRLALLAPALVALAAAVLAVRAAVLVVRAVTARAPRTTVGLVVGRRAARTPSTLDPAMVLAAGLALTTFALQLWQLSDRNQGLRAVAAVGADTVLQVDVPRSVDLVAAVRQADPGGRYAMAAAERATSADGGTSRLVAVDSSRLAAVAPWLFTARPTGARAGLPGDVARRLHPARPAPVVLRGQQLRVRLRTDELRHVDGSTRPVPTPRLSLTLDPGGGWQSVDLGALAEGRADVEAPIPCRRGCRLVSLNLYTAAGHDYETSFTVTALSTDTQPASTFAASLRTPGHWQERVGQVTDPQRAALATPTDLAAGLRVVATDSYGDTTVRVAPTDVADPLPAVLAAGLAAEPFPGTGPTVIGTGLDGQSQQLAVVARLPILPRSLDDGVLVDLTEVSRLSDPAEDEAVDEVWLAAGAPPTVRQALTAAGIRVTGEQRLTDVRHQLHQQAVSRGALMITVIALAALLVAGLALVGGRAIEAPRRRLEWATVADTGLSPRRIRLLALVEIAVPALLAVLIGTAVGLGTALAAARVVPLVDPTAPGPPLQLGPDWGSVVRLVVIAVAVVVVVAAVGSRAETGSRR